MSKGVYIRKPFSEEHKKNISLSKKGTVSSMKGKKLSKERIEKMRKCGLENPVRYWLGKKRSEETKEKISKARKGMKFSEEVKSRMGSGNRGKTTWIKGKHHSDETRQLLSDKLKGENSPNWQGGITPKSLIIRHSLDIKKWRKSVFERDNYTCQRCKENSRFLAAHHILNFSEFEEFRTDINNGITLCKSCHLLFHKIYGKNKNNRDEINQFIKNMLPQKTKKEIRIPLVKRFGVL